ncbi:hypothetical protein [Microbacterium album]|uniref:Uncharacterized protein n=1 Tax=Microbacterium album TaxID=2053191 RepID=A0A917MNQ0_9MICO|nr:hypothetical protein [Microbacterium album]GGH42672.1 hypothetical protein GCM10010921_16030 [Microbacterium album]
MDQATASATRPASPVAAAGAPATGTRSPSGRPSQLGRDLLLLGIVGALLAASIAAGFAVLYRQFWGPSAFVERYVSLLAEGRAAEALNVPGVALDTRDLEAAGLPATASEALLRSAVMNRPLSDVEVLSERTVDGVTEVTVGYLAEGRRASSTYRVVRDGTEGLVPRWSFATSPLAVIDLTVRGSMRFTVNDFEIDKRQVSPDGAEAEVLAPVPLLVFSPGLYAITVDTPTARAEETLVLADAAMRGVRVDIQAEPTEEFTGVVQEQVENFLRECGTQQVLQPTGCPFGISIDDRVDGETISWSIIQDPVVEIVPHGAYWAIAPATATAHVEAEVRSIFDGSVYQLSEDVPFVIDGTIDILPDGTASILIGSPMLR